MAHINEIWTHPLPHVDEVVGIWLLLTFGEEKFPGISNAEIKFVGPYDMRGKDWAQLELEGVVCVGVGKGRFDEHPSEKAVRKEGKCAATLVADYLGLRTNPDIVEILNYAQDNDLNGSTSRWELGALLKNAFKYTHQEDPDTVIATAFILLEGLWRAQTSFGRCKEDILRDGRPTSFRKGNGNIVKVMSVTTENPEMHKYLMSQAGGFYALVITFDSKGRAKIFSWKKHFEHIDFIAHDIRVATLVNAGYQGRYSPSQLESEGEIQGAEEWYYFREGGMLFNGTQTNPNVPASTLSRDNIERIVLESATMFFS